MPPASRPNDGGRAIRRCRQEARIATLVSRGQDTRDVTTRPFITPSRAKYHLHKVFWKLGVTSRTQLACRVIDTVRAAALVSLALSASGAGTR